MCLNFLSTSATDFHTVEIIEETELALGFEFSGMEGMDATIIGVDDTVCVVAMMYDSVRHNVVVLCI